MRSRRATFPVTLTTLKLKASSRKPRTSRLEAVSRSVPTKRSDLTATHTQPTRLNSGGSPHAHRQGKTHRQETDKLFTSTRHFLLSLAVSCTTSAGICRVQGQYSEPARFDSLLTDSATSVGAPLSVAHHASLLDEVPTGSPTHLLCEQHRVHETDALP